MHLVLGSVPRLQEVCAPCAQARTVSATTAVLLWGAGLIVVAVACLIAWRARSGPSHQGALVGVVALSLLGAATWLFVNGAVEGRLLIALSGRHGITVGDLAALPFAATAVWALIALRSSVRDRRQSAPVA